MLTRKRINGLAMGDILEPPGHPIAYFSALTRVTGSVKAAILVQQVSYWTPRAHDKDGWIYKSQAEWMDETGFTLKEFRGACEELEARKYDRGNHQSREPPTEDSTANRQL
jgi:hypothetical protein